MTWDNRIVGEGEEAPDQLLAHPQNFRIHPATQQAALEAILREVGYVQRIVVNRQTGHVLDGHLRVTAAITNGQAKVPVTYVDVSPAEEAKILASFDAISSLAVLDEPQFKELVGDIEWEEAALADLTNDIIQGFNGQLAAGNSAEVAAGNGVSFVFGDELKTTVSTELYGDVRAAVDELCMEHGIERPEAVELWLKRCVQ